MRLRNKGKFKAMEKGDKVQGKNGVYTALDNKYLTTSEMIRAINNDEVGLENMFSRYAASIHKKSLKPKTKEMQNIVIDLIDSAKQTL